MNCWLICHLSRHVATYLISFLWLHKKSTALAMHSMDEREKKAETMIWIVLTIQVKLLHSTSEDIWIYVCIWKGAENICIHSFALSLSSSPRFLFPVCSQLLRNFFAHGHNTSLTLRAQHSLCFDKSEIFWCVAELIVALLAFTTLFNFTLCAYTRDCIEHAHSACQIAKIIQITDYPTIHTSAAVWHGDRHEIPQH